MFWGYRMMKKNLLKTVGVLTTGLFLAVPLAVASSSAKASEAEAASTYVCKEYEYANLDTDYGWVTNLLDGDYSTGVKVTAPTYISIERADKHEFLPQSVTLVFAKESGVATDGRIRQHISGDGGYDRYYWHIEDEVTEDYKIVTANFQFTSATTVSNVQRMVSNSNIQIIFDGPGTLQEVIINESIDTSLVSYEAKFNMISLDQSDKNQGFDFNTLPSLFDGDEKTGIRFNKQEGSLSYIDLDFHEAKTINDFKLSIPSTSATAADGTSNSISRDALQIFTSSDGSDFTNEVTIADDSCVGTYNSMVSGRTAEAGYNGFVRYLIPQTTITSRYYRIGLANETGWFSMSEIEWNTLENPAVISATQADETTKVAVVTDSYKAGEYGFIIDNDFSTFAWFAGSLSYVNFTYRAPISAYGAFVQVGHDSGDHFSGNVEYKDGNGVWQIAGTFACVLTKQEVLFNGLVTAQEWRIAATNGSGEHSPVGTWAAVKEFQLYDDVTTDGTWTIPYQNIHQNPMKISDGDFNTSAWFDWHISYDASIVLNFGSMKSVSDVLLFQTGLVGHGTNVVPDTQSNDQLYHFRLDYYDGSQWVQIHEYQDTPELIHVFSSPIQASAVRVVNLDNSSSGSSSYGAVIREFSVNSLTEYFKVFDAGVKCDDGVTAPSQSGWGDAKDVFDGLDSEIQDYLKDYVVDSTVIGVHLEKYEYIIDKYGTTKYPNYIKRGELERTGRVSPIVSIFGTLGDNDILLPVIILVAIVSVSLMGVVVYRKKRI